MWALMLPLLFIFTIVVIERSTLTGMRGARGTRASLLIAYEATTLACNLYLSVAGLLAWLPFAPFAAEGERAASERLQADVPYVRSHILVPMIAHCLWDLVLYVSIPELRQLPLIVHHLVTALLGYLALYPVAFAHYYDIYFAGVAEVSNVPLSLLEVFKLLPQLSDRYPRARKLARTAFGVSFCLLRLIMWPIVSFRFWSDTLQSIFYGRVHSLFIACVYLSSNTVLTWMQFVWGRKFFKERGNKSQPSNVRGD